MKKAFDQTVRDLKREVNKKVLNVPRIEQKILDATSNEHWGPHGSLMADIAEASRNYHEYQLIMSVIWKRINDTGKNWRHVYKGLTVLEYLVAHGSERVIDDIKEHVYQISTLSAFQYIDSKGRDQGNNVRKKSQTLVALVNDKERIQEVREKAIANRDKFRSTFSRNELYRAGYGSRYDDDRYGGRYGGWDDDRNGYGRNRGYGDDDRNNRDDRYGRYSDYRGQSKEEDYKFGSRSRSADRGRERSPDDDKYSSRNGGRADGTPQAARPIERTLSEPDIDAPPTYEEATKDAHNNIPNQGDIETSAVPAPRPPSPPEAKSSQSEATNSAPPSAIPPVQNNDLTFDEFDPRGSFSAAQSMANTLEMELFGGLSALAEDPINSLALVPVTSVTASEPDAPPTSGWEDSFTPASSASFSNQAIRNPFGDPPFTAQQNLTGQTQNRSNIPIQSVPGFSNGHPPSTPGFPPPQPQAITSNSVLGGLSSEAVTSSAFPLQSIPTTSLARAQSAPPDVIVQSALTALPNSIAAPSGMQSLAVPTNHPPNSFATRGPVSQAAPLGLLGTPLASQSSMPPQPKHKFETKSTVWADTISRGLVDLNISGSKTNPLADIGVDFDSINRKEKREKHKSSSISANSTNFVSTVSMGKAMGSGSGIGRAGSIGLAPSLSPMMGSSASAYSGGMNQSMGMGMNAGMNQGIMAMRPGIGMPLAYNQMGMGGYGSQPYGGYR